MSYRKKNLEMMMKKTMAFGDSKQHNHVLSGRNIFIIIIII